MFQHVVAEGDLPIGGHYHLAVAPHANHSGGTNPVTNPGMLCRDGTLARSQEKTSGNGASGRPELLQDAVTSISQRESRGPQRQVFVAGVGKPGSPATGLRR